MANGSLRGIFTEIERKKSDGRAQRAASYAKRFAAKEACSKALGTGLRRGVFWRDMGVVNLPGGKPSIKLTGGALKRLEEITPPGHEPSDRFVDHRRFSAGAGHCHHFGRPAHGQGIAKGAAVTRSFGLAVKAG